MAWILLILAGLCEVAGVMGINRWNRRRTAASFMLLSGGFALSFVLLSAAMQSIAMSTAYAVWTAIGTAGGTLLGMAVYGEPRGWRRILFLAMVVGAAVGLKLID